MHLQPEGAALLEDICSSTLFSADELLRPTAEERLPPDYTPPEGLQSSLLS